MFVISTRNFPPEIGGMQNLMGGLAVALLKHGPVKVFAEKATEEEFDKRTNPQGRDYYWLSGKFVNNDEGQDTDEWALENGYVSLVPVQFDLTAHHFINQLNDWKLDE